MLLTACIVFSTALIDSAEMRTWGLDTLSQIRSELFIPDRNLYGEEAKPGEKPKNVAFTWSVGIMVQALDSAAKVDASYKSVLQQYIDAYGSYWNPEGPVPGYDVWPMPKPKDRYYDDNEWMVMAFADAATVLKSKHDLDLAKGAFSFAMSGKDNNLGGGIYWRESDKASKNTCSNAPAAAGALALFEQTHEPSYLHIAEELYDWTKSHLRDPSDGLYWDNVGLSGKITKWKFSYNTGLMLRTAAELYRFTKRDEYAQDAKEMQAASLKKWTDPEGNFTDDLKFMVLLLENWLRAYRLVPGAEDPRPVISVGLTRMHNLSRDSLGHYGNKCNDRPTKGPYSPFHLIDQAAAAQAFLLAAD
jgi:hypothetical protein